MKDFKSKDSLDFDNDFIAAVDDAEAAINICAHNYNKHNYNKPKLAVARHFLAELRLRFGFGTLIERTDRDDS